MIYRQNRLLLNGKFNFILPEFLDLQRPARVSCSRDEQQGRTMVAAVASLREAVLRQKADQAWNSDDLGQVLLSSPPFSQGHLLEVIHGLQDSSRALRFFEWWSSNAKEWQPTSVAIHGPTAFELLFNLASRESPQSHLRIQQLLCKSREHNLLLTAASASIVIRSFARAGLSEDALQVFLGDTPPSARKASLYNDILDALLLSSPISGPLCHDQVINLVHEMLRHHDTKCHPNHVTCSILLTAALDDQHVRAGDGRNRDRLIDLLLEVANVCATFPSQRQLSQLLTRLCKNGSPEKAMDVVLFLKKKGRHVHLICCNILLTGFGAKSDFMRMNLFLSEMKNWGIQPSVVTFGILINSLCKSHRIDEALQVFRSMTSASDINIIPDVVLINTLIGGLCRVGRPEEGLAFLEKMISENESLSFIPNTVTYNCLIDGFCKAGDLDTALMLFQRMADHKISPSEITSNTIIDGMCKHGRLSSALCFFREMCNSKMLRGNVVTYTILMGAFLQVNNVSKAMELYREMSGHGLAPDYVTYFTLISGLCIIGRLQEACSVASAMKQNGFLLKAEIYTMLIGGFCKKNKLNRVYELLKEMDSAGVEPNLITYNTVICAFCKAGDLQNALQIMNKMAEPSVFTYSTLIHGYCQANKLDEAMNLYSSMKIPPNNVIYNILIDSFCKQEKLDAAFHLMDEMQVRGVFPNVATYNALFKGLSQRNMLEKAFLLVDQMNSSGCNPDYITMEILTEWFSAAGETVRLKSLCKEK